MRGFLLDMAENWLLYIRKETSAHKHKLRILLQIQQLAFPSVRLIHLLNSARPRERGK